MPSPGLSNFSMATTALFLFSCFLTCWGASLGPGPRQLSCNVVYNNTLYVWGGAQVAPGYPNFTSTTLPLSTTDPTVWTDLSWDIPVILADKTKDILADPCVVSPSGILVVGGTNLFGFDLNAKVYVSLNLTGGNPLTTLATRHNVRNVAVEGSIYYFGGYADVGLNVTTSPPHPELFILNMTTWNWKSDSVANTEMIPPNYEEASVIYGDNGFIYMIGGASYTPIIYYFSDIYKYNIGTRTWAAVTPSFGGWTTGMDNSRLVKYNGTIYVFHGGSDFVTSGQPGNRTAMVNLTRAYDIQLNRVSQQDISLSQYAPNASVFNKPGVIGDAVIFISGIKDGQSAVNGTWAYNLTLNDWTNSVAAGPYLPSLFDPSNSTSSSSTPSTTPLPSNGAGGPNIGVILGLVIAVIVVIAALAFFLVRRSWRRNSGSTPHLQKPDIISLKLDDYLHKPNLTSHEPDGVTDTTKPQV
ncbi:hypothetical protein BC938DRAFT_471563 [Jimgerdemannia flammicorona]|uniref:Galactose oxidase n=1 Tax=Jimgerdemannia flammicorona TaxID=994334 RepID=A0A433Q7W6_9FUNG|nr:hypothetical protein BC938DRAFT_471563 [Jimgerdemannia flammicorona]